MASRGESRGAPKQTELPFLPGMSFPHQKSKLTKAQQFEFVNGYAMVRGNVGAAAAAAATPAISMEEIQQAMKIDPELVYGAGKARSTDSAATDDTDGSNNDLENLVLRYDAFFKETVYESPEENYRVRRVKIHVYMEDDSIMVTERKIENSGLQQGMLLKRQRIPKEEGGFFSAEDFICGRNVTIYGRTFRVLNCDDFTRAFMRETIGVDAGEPQQAPQDPYTLRRVKLQSNQRVHSLSHGKRAQLKRFLENDRRVLRFYCYWDDRNNMFGEKRKFVIHYFLVDDTVEVKEVVPANAGRDPFPVFIKRSRLPRQFNELSDMASEEFYTDADFRLGDEVAVFGRRFVIYDADQYTKQYYQDVYGVTDWEAVNIEDPAPPAPVKTIPPPTGFGSEEDSLMSCTSLMAKPPRRNFQQYIENDRKVLRFAARWEGASNDDADRRFVVSFYLADDTVGVFEKPLRNSGIVGGKFLQRSKVKQPGAANYLAANDLRLGASIVLFGRTFVLEQADEFALGYMESNPHLWPESDLISIRASLKPLLAKDAFASVDPAASGSISGEQLVQVLASVAPQLHPQSVLTLQRAYAKDGVVGYNDLLRDVASA